jgi:hypothetical protein
MSKRNAARSAPQVRHEPPPGPLVHLVEEFLKVAAEKFGRADPLDLIFSKLFHNSLTRWKSGTGRDETPRFQFHWTQRLLAIFDCDYNKLLRLRYGLIPGAEKEWQRLVKLIEDWPKRSNILDGLRLYLAEISAHPAVTDNPRIPLQERAWKWRPQAMGEWRQKLNQAFEGVANVSDTLAREMSLTSIGSYQVEPTAATDDLRDRILEVRKANGEPGKDSNQFHAVIAWDDFGSDASPAWQYYETDYATLRALGDFGLKVPGLYAGAVVTCSKRQLVYLHRRSPTVDRYQNQFHTMSGNFVPRGDFKRDMNGLRDTARREIFEEMTVAIDVDAQRYPTILIHELETGRWMCSYLGVDIPEEEADRIHSSPEGEVVPVPFARLGEFLEREDWVQSGRLNVLSWLALGAFTVGSGPGFDNLVALDHLQRCLKAPKL